MLKAPWLWIAPCGLGVALAIAQPPTTPPAAPPPAVQPPPSAQPAPGATALPQANPLAPPAAQPAGREVIDIPKNEPLAPGQTVDQVLADAIAIRQQAEQLPPGQQQTILFAEAIKRFASVYSSDATNVEAMLQIGEISMVRNDTINGREYFSRVIRIEGKNYRANRGLGEFYLLTRYYRQAVPFLEVAIEAAPKDKLGETYRLLAAGYYETRYFDRSLETITEAFKLLPDNPLVADYRTRVLLTMQKLDEARTAADDLLNITRRRVAEVGYDKERVRQHMQAYDLKADVLTAVHNSLHRKNAKNEVTDQPFPGKEQEVAKILDEIVETRAAQLPVINTLALLDVIPLCEKALKYSPENPKYLWTLSRVCVEARLYGDALATLEKLVQVDPQNVQARAALAQLQAEIAAMQGPAQPSAPPGSSAPPPGAAPIQRP